MTHYSADLLHQILSLPGTKFISDCGTVWGRMYVIEYNGVKHVIAATPIEPGEDVLIDVKKVNKAEELKKQAEQLLRTAPEGEPLMFSDFLKGTYESN